MERNELKARTTSGFIYKFAERVGAQGINLLVSILLARILMPEEYGIIALVTVFIAMCDVFVTYGFGNSLIVNKRSDQLDFSTCFFSGIALSIIVYAGIFFSAPFIAEYFANDLLTPVIRVMGIRVLLAAVNSVQHAYVSKHMMFKKFFYSTLIGTVVSGVIAVIMAYNGFGVWALIEQYLGNVFLDTVFLWIIVGWRPSFVFSFTRLKRILQYGWKILVTGLIDTGYRELRSLVIGKKYSSADLAYYNKGLMFPSFTNKLIEPTVNTVLFPALSHNNDHPALMKETTRKVVKVSTYLLAPVMIGLFVVAKPMVTVILTPKWLPCVIYLQIGCIAYLVRPMMYIGDCVIKASGRSDLLLKLDFLGKVIGVSLLLISMRYGVFWIAVSLTATTIISTAIVTVSSKGLIGYSIKEQLCDVSPNILLSVIMGGIVWSLSYFHWSPLLTLLIQVFTGVLVYFVLSVVFKIEGFRFIKGLVLNVIKKKTKKGENHNE